MKIEFKKVPSTPKELLVESNSVKIEGTFCKITQSLVKIDAVLIGNTEIDCDRCGITEDVIVDEKLDFLLSDGIFKNDECEDLVIEVDNSTIDFDELIESELASIKSEYHLCKNCLQDGDEFEKEF